MASAFLGLGSNLGDRRRWMARAVARLQAHPQITLKACSSLYANPPVGYQAQPDFLNAVVEVETSLTPAALLETALEVERCLGRERHLRWGPRNIDIDLLLYDDVEVAEPHLTVPHPRLQERAFVLVPLAEIAPDLRLPDGRSARQAAEEVEGHADLSIYCQGCQWCHLDGDPGGR